MNKSSLIWQKIISNDEQWFSKNNMNFWGTKVYWNTLTPFQDGSYLFITADYDFYREKKLFSIRWVGEGGTIGTFAWQTAASLEEAKKQMKFQLKESSYVTTK